MRGAPGWVGIRYGNMGRRPGDLSLVRLRSERDGSLGMEGDDSDVDRKVDSLGVTRKRVRPRESINERRDQAVLAVRI